MLLFILVVIFALTMVAFWIDQDNTEEMHFVAILALALLGIMLISFAPWQVQVFAVSLSLMPKLFISILHFFH